MFNRILVPLDGSALAECTLPHALAMARLADASIVLLRVLEESDVEAGVDPIEWHLRKAAAQTYLDMVSAKLQAQDVAADALLLAGSPAERIVEQVEKLNVDLLVVSSHGQSGRMDWSLGAVAHKLVQGVGTSVMLVRVADAPQKMDIYQPVRYCTLLVSLDGSRRAECVLPIAERLAEQQDAELVLAHVVQRPSLLGWSLLAEEERRLAEQLVERTQAVAESYLRQVQERQPAYATIALAQADNVATELNQMAEQYRADLLLVSAHGAAANPQRSFGDTVNGILTYSRQPLLIYQDHPASRAAEPRLAPLRGKLEDLDSLSTFAA